MLVPIGEPQGPELFKALGTLEEERMARKSVDRLNFDRGSIRQERPERTGVALPDGKGEHGEVLELFVVRPVVGAHEPKITL
jgi:hypothetical protein